MSLPAQLRAVVIHSKLAMRGVLGAALFEKLKFLLAHHRWPRLPSATTFNEKVLARKLDPPDARYATVSDKVAVREWVAQRIGEQYLVPLRAIYAYDAIDRLDLAPGQVIKCANRSGGVYFTSGQSGIDRARLIEAIRNDLDFDFANWSGEPWYDDIPKRVVAEASLSDASGAVPRDYKFFVFHGKVRTIQVDLDRFVAHRRAMFDRDWNPLPCIYGQRPPKVPPERPRSLDRMLDIAETLGREFDFVRVDLYEIDDHQIYFGEMTLAPASGLKRFVPADYDRALGSYW
jgi:hypothetical protein